MEAGTVPNITLPLTGPELRRGTFDTGFPRREVVGDFKSDFFLHSTIGGKSISSITARNADMRRDPNKVVDGMTRLELIKDTVA